jgi:hypothetical protein
MIDKVRSTYSISASEKIPAKPKERAPIRLALQHYGKKWPWLSALDDAPPLKKRASDGSQNVVSTFGSDALGRPLFTAIQGGTSVPRRAHGKAAPDS